MQLKCLMLTSVTAFVIVPVGKEKMSSPKPVVEKKVLSIGMKTVLFIMGIGSYPQIAAERHLRSLLQ